jgi:hypothetical protein
MVLGTCLFLITTGCGKKVEPPAQSEQQAEKDQVSAAGLDPALARAVAEASSAGTPAASAPGTSDGPPPRGVFPPGGADAQARLDAAPRITVGSTGSEPRLRLTGGFGSKQAPLRSRLQIVLQTAPGQGGLPIEFVVQFEEAANLPATEEGAPARRSIRGRVTGASLPAKLAGRVPPQLQDGLAKLRGSEVRFEVSPDGGATGFRTEVNQGTPPELADVVRTLSDVIATAVLPYPEEPVGAGGFWMVTSRDGLMGLDLVTYRMVRVESLAEGVATLQVSTKRYAASSDFSLTGLDGSYLLEEFQSVGEASLRYRAGSSLPLRGRMQSNIAAVLSPRGAQGAALGAPGGRGTLQFVSEAQFSEP